LESLAVTAVAVSFSIRTHAQYPTPVVSIANSVLRRSSALIDHAGGGDFKTKISMKSGREG
jgi:hypothetical protein